MTDDQVTRLRVSATEERPLWRAEMILAANEIERLRAENQNLKDEKAYWRLMGRETGGF